MKKSPVDANDIFSLIQNALTDKVDDIPSSRLCLTTQTLGVAFEFVGNYASVDFHHRALICPSYYKNVPDDPSGIFHRKNKTKTDQLYSNYARGVYGIKNEGKRRDVA